MRDTVDGTTRRRLLGTTDGFVTLFRLGANGTASQDATPPGQADRTVETIHGPVTVPGDATRIVAIKFPSAVALLELGVTPVGIPSYMPALPPGYPSIEDIVVVENDAAELDLDKIAGLAPDLIIGSDWKDPAQQQAPYDQLTKIAPTALFEWTQAAGYWAAEAAGCAAAVGETAELDKLRTAFEQRAAQIKTTYAGTIANVRWDILSASETNWYLYGPNSSHGKVVVAAGIRLSAARQIDGYVEYSFEQFNVLTNSGAMLLRSVGDASLTTLPKIATYTDLPAVIANHVYTSDYFFPSSYGLSNALLTDVENALKALGS